MFILFLRIFLLRRDFAVGLKPSYFLWYNPITLINPSILSFGTSLNRLNVPTFVKEFLRVSAKSMQSRRMCIIVKGASLDCVIKLLMRHNGFKKKYYTYLCYCITILPILDSNHRDNQTSYMYQWTWSYLARLICLKILKKITPICNLFG